MIAGRCPRMIFAHKRRLVEPNLPKYMPFTKIDLFIALKFEIPLAAQGSMSSSSQLLLTERSTAARTAALDAISLHASTFLPFADLAFNRSHLPLSPPSFILTKFDSNFNTLLDSGCAHHIIRDRSLFSNFVAKTISVRTATFGSLEALGSGDVDFRYPYADRHVTFTLRGCLFAPTAPINLLSVNVLIERGMSCIFSPGGITKVFFPNDHPKLRGLVFHANIMNRFKLSFLELVFVPPASTIPNPSAFPALSHPISLSTIPADSSPPFRITPQVPSTAGQAHDDFTRLPDLCMAERLPMDEVVLVVDDVEHGGAIVPVGVDVVAGIGDIGVLNGGAEDRDADECWGDVCGRIHTSCPSSSGITDPTTLAVSPNPAPSQQIPPVSSFASTFLPFASLTSPSFSTSFNPSFTSVQRLYVTSPPQIVDVPRHRRPIATSSPRQSTAYDLTPFNSLQQNSLTVICCVMVAVGEHRCAGVVSTSSVATALPVHGGVVRVDALVEMDVSVDLVNGGVPVQDQAANSCGDQFLGRTRFQFQRYSALEFVFSTSSALFENPVEVHPSPIHCLKRQPSLSTQQILPISARPVPTLLQVVVFISFHFLMNLIILFLMTVFAFLSLSSAFFTFHGGAHLCPSVLICFCIGYTIFTGIHRVLFIFTTLVDASFNDDYNDRNHVRNLRPIQLFLLPPTSSRFNTTGNSDMQLLSTSPLCMASNYYFVCFCRPSRSRVHGAIDTRSP